MNEDSRSLWSASGPWRAIVLLTAACLALGLLGAPWRGQQAAQPAAAGSYASSPPAAPGAGSGSTPAPATPGAVIAGGAAPPQAGDADRIEATGSAVLRTGPNAPAPAQPPRSSLGVVWSQGSGRMPGPAISGGGLILGYGGWGARSVGHVDRGVTTGKHYWELTFSAQPGETHPQSWTSAGIIGLSPTPDMSDLMRLHEAGSLVLEVGRDKSVRNGDVLMFALDAENRLGYWGLNGAWRNGVPGERGGTPLTLRSGQQFMATGSAAAPKAGGPEGDRWIANFGATAYRYPVPAGFGPYAVGRNAQAAAATAAPAPGQLPPEALLGKSFEGSVDVSGETVPLPQGRWTVLAHFRGNAGQTGDAVLLGQLQGKEMRRMVAVQAARARRPVGATTFRGCLRQDVFFQSNDAGRTDAPSCWWVNHTTGTWDEQTLFKAARLELDQRGVQASSVWLNVGFYRSDADGFAVAFYYFDPGEEGIRSQPYLWSQSEWHKSRIDADAARSAYARKLVDWGRTWAPVFFASR